jgi:very-short-patch-repair endonuclease
MKIHVARVTHARELRKNSTNAESALWAELRNRRLCGYRFKRQHPIGPYIVDFVCLDARLVVELDGGQHQASAQYDAARTDYLNERRYSVIRFWNNQVLNELDGVKQAIFLALSAKTAKPSPGHFKFKSPRANGNEHL